MKARTLVVAVSLLFGGWSFPSNPAAQTTSSEGNSKSGSICVLPNSPEPPTRISPGGEYNPDTLTVGVDKRQSIRWPHKHPVLIDGLDLQERHLVVLTSDGKRIQSFRFKFFPQDDDGRVCLYFDGYQGVQLGDRKGALWCKVKNRDCWR
jgi:hypothetical protein